MNLNKFKKNLRKEYKDTFKDELEVIEPKRIERRRLAFKPIFAFITILVFSILVIQHIGVNIYNTNIEKQNNELVNSPDKQITKIDNTKDIKSQLNYIKKEKKSVLENIFSMQLIGCGSMAKDNMIEPPPMMDAPTNEGADNSYDTNIQEESIDEADIIKCDGKYIYSLIGRGNLYVFDLIGKIIDKETVISNELYIYNDKIVCVGRTNTQVFSFNGVELTSIDIIEYDMYTSSRLINNELYIVSSNYFNNILNILNQETTNDVYYDNCINPSGVISMYKYNLDTNEYNKIDVITSYDAILYTSENNFYIASRNYYKGNYTFISIIDYDLNPIGSVNVEGTINNQFSMDEHNNYLRVVSTDITKGPLNINQISIFSLDTLERVGYLNEGIGLERHTVRSVRYDDDTCYIVTYMNQDPLYEIDLSDVTNPNIVSVYQAPGYSTYLHNFIINNQKYLFGIGYDDFGNLKISVYIDNGNETIQIGKDVIITTYRGINSMYKDVDYYIVDEYLLNIIAINHKSLFIYNDNEYLFIGGIVGRGQYAIFKIDVTQEEHVISVHKEYKQLDIERDTRTFLIDSKLYVVESNNLIVDEWS